MSVSLSGSSTTSGVSINGTTGVQGTISSLGISTSVNESVVIGYGGAINQTGLNNMFAGYEVAALSTTGNKNVGIGYRAAYTLAGDGNVIIGSSAAAQMTIANGNVVVGVGSARLLQGAYSNVLVGAGADANAANASGAIAIGANSVASGGSGNALLAAVALGRGASADGRYALALGTGVSAIGDGSFTVANRVRGYYSAADAGSYVVQIDADALKIANGGALAFTPRTLTVVSSALSATPMDQAAAWRAAMEGDDLVFRSVGGAVVRFVDDYVSGVLDFVATHDSEWAEDGRERAPREAVAANRGAGRHPLAYLIVSSAADEAGLVDGTAVPRVRLCRSHRDCRAAFGVVAPDQRVSRRVGHIAFSDADVDADAYGCPIGDRDRKRVCVSSLGEGWIWVRNATPLAATVGNGDLLVAAPDAGGAAELHDATVGMADAVACARAVAKATMTVDIASGGIALVPCTYRF